MNNETLWQQRTFLDTHYSSATRMMALACNAILSDQT